MAAPAPRNTACGCFNQFHSAVRNEVVPAIHADLGGQTSRIVTAGASIGAFNAVAVLCRYPDVFEAALGMSGTYDLQRFLARAFTEDLYYSSPLDFLPGLDGHQLELLRQRRVILASGEGAWEDLGSSWAMADALGSKGIPNRVDSWGPDWEHDWPTWLRMLPHYLDELCLTAEPLEEQRLGEAGPLEVGQVEALVRRVRPGVGVLDPGDQHLGVRERPHERREEPDRPADADLDRRVPHASANAERAAA